MIKKRKNKTNLLQLFKQWPLTSPKSTAWKFVPHIMKPIIPNFPGIKSNGTSQVKIW